MCGGVNVSKDERWVGSSTACHRQVNCPIDVFGPSLQQQTLISAQLIPLQYVRQQSLPAPSSQHMPPPPPPPPPPPAPNPMLLPPPAPPSDILDMSLLFHDSHSRCVATVPPGRLGNLVRADTNGCEQRHVDARCDFEPVLGRAVSTRSTLHLPGRSPSITHSATPVRLVLSWPRTAMDARYGRTVENAVCHLGRVRAVDEEGLLAAGKHVAQLNVPARGKG